MEEEQTHALPVVDMISNKLSGPVLGYGRDNVRQLKKWTGEFAEESVSTMLFWPRDMSRDSLLSTLNRAVSSQGQRGTVERFRIGLGLETILQKSVRLLACNASYISPLDIRQCLMHISHNTMSISPKEACHIAHMLLHFVNDEFIPVECLGVVFQIISRFISRKKRKGKLHVGSGLEFSRDNSSDHPTVHGDVGKAPSVRHSRKKEDKESLVQRAIMLTSSSDSPGHKRLSSLLSINPEFVDMELLDDALGFLNTLIVSMLFAHSISLPMLKLLEHFWIVVDAANFLHVTPGVHHKVAKKTASMINRNALVQSVLMALKEALISDQQETILEALKVVVQLSDTECVPMAHKMKIIYGCITIGKSHCAHIVSDERCMNIHINVVCGLLAMLNVLSIDDPVINEAICEICATFFLSAKFFDIHVFTHLCGCLSTVLDLAEPALAMKTMGSLLICCSNHSDIMQHEDNVELIRFLIDLLKKSCLTSPIEVDIIHTALCRACPGVERDAKVFLEEQERQWEDRLVINYEIEPILGEEGYFVEIGDPKREK
ncbi:hypothetical protein ADUPG1_011011 [Aduncisulcus paluster]|uniref:Uncharacterized protein n=1 Tax=Aduncisulcus paluster TaxID=2918883 RepID=A0ABQ5JU85_9EUKA|nr:hypothetical protein ADUPG1_011011 [Aduncisulcus paluster]